MKTGISKIVSVGICLAISVSLLAGCANTKVKETEQKETEQKQVEQTTTSQATTTSAPIKMETVQVWTNNAATKDEDEKMVADFNAGIGKEKGIEIDYKIYGGDYMNVLNIAAAADQAPHLFKVTIANLVQFSNAKWILPIEDFPGSEAFLKKYEGLLRPGSNVLEGKTYTVPVAINTIGVAYNKDLLKKNGFDNPPETWSELREMAKVITKNGAGKEFGFIEGLKSTGTVSVNGLWHYVSSVGRNEFNHVTGKYDFESIKPFLQLWADMKTDGSWFPGIEGLNNDQARAQFAEGNIGFKLSASWDPGVWTTQFPAKMEWGICTPVEDKNTVYKNYAWQNISIILGAKSKELPEKAMEVFKLWTSDEMVIHLFEAGKAIPYTTELIKAATVQPSIKNFPEMAALVNTSYLYPNNPASFLKLEGDNLATVLSKVILGVMTPDAAVADLDKRFNEALNKAIAEGLDINEFMDNTNVSIK